MSRPPFIQLSGVQREYRTGAGLVRALDHIDLGIGRGDFLAITGPSGSGKSTLMHILGCLDRPTRGTYLLDNLNVFEADDHHLSRLRACHIGFIFQTFNLLPALTVFENVALPFHYQSSGREGVRERVLDAVQKVGLYTRLDHKPAQLSGGEMQRVAIARAMVISPKLILADEPTGNLDTKTSEGILQLFSQCHREGATVILVTHDPGIAARADAVVELKDGCLQ